MTIIVGIFDETRDLDRALEKLADEGIEDIVYDQAIVGQEAASVGLLFAPGGGPTPGVAGTEVEPGSGDRRAIMRAFRAHLADYRVAEAVIDYYANVFYHEGKFVLVKTNKQRAQQVEAILRESRAVRVDRHG